MKKNVIIFLFILGVFSISLNACNSKKDNLSSLKIGICTNYSNSKLMEQNGYSFVEETVGRFLIPSKGEFEFDSIVNDLSNYSLPVVACNSFIPKDLKSVGPNAVHSEILAFAETAFQRANKVGVEIIVFGSGGSRQIPDDFPRDEARLQFIDLCKKMAPIAKKYNIVVVLEPLNKKECNFINSVAEGGEIVKEVDHSNFRLLVDFYHMKMDDEGPENIVKYGQLIKHVHIAEEQDRAFPGKYNEDFTPYYDALKDINYQGLISIEARWDDIEEQMPTAIESIKQQLKKIEI